MSQGRDPRLEALAVSGWLAETPPGFRDAVLDRCMVRQYLRGDAVYRAGDPPGGLYGLIAGAVGVELSPDDRQPYVATFARPGFWIGEGSVVTRGPRFIGIRSVRDSILAHLPLVQWDAIVASVPEAWRWLAGLCLRNELQAVAVADALMIRGSEARLAAILLVLARQNLAPPAPGAPTEIEVSQDDLSRMANLSRSSAGRVLKAFEAAGIIATSYRAIRVVDPDGLRARTGTRGSG